MRITGERKKRNYDQYKNHTLAPFVREYMQVLDDIKKSHHIDAYTNLTEAVKDKGSLSTLREFFMKDMVDSEASLYEQEQQRKAFEVLFENTQEAVLEQSVMSGHLAAVTPLVGLSFPLFKNILMTNIFDSGVIPKTVSQAPTGTLTMERRILVAPDGEEIDMFKQQDQIKRVIDSAVPYSTVELTVPELGTTDILTLMGAGSQDHLSRDTYIVEILVNISAGVDAWVPVNIGFSPSYDGFERQAIYRLALKTGETVVDTAGNDVVLTADIVDNLSATITNDRFTVTSAGKITKVKVKTRKDTSNGLTAGCTVKWDTKSTYYEIPDAIPFNTTISPEEIKDIAASYNNENQMTKLMAMVKDAMANHKNDTIYEKLNDSFALLPDTEKVNETFSFAPPDGNYLLGPVKWRHEMFYDRLDTYVTQLLQVLNDPNIEVQIFGGTDNIRRITPTEYSYASPEAKGTVKLDFKKTVFTSDERKYAFTSSQKIKDDNITIVLNPTNNERIIYQIMDYQLYVGNDIRNAKNPTLPAMHCFERWLFMAYQPVQGKIHIINKNGELPPTP